MSRSYKHTPHIHFCGRSNKKARSNANRRFRRKAKMALAKGDELLPLSLREIVDVWDFPTDGLGCIILNLDPKYLRK